MAQAIYDLMRKERTTVMDITRNWRLKMSRSQLMATRCPTTGAVILPQQSGVTRNGHAEAYTFDVDTGDPRLAEGESDYARAAR
jgi:uncharacterized OB-fold protein